MNESAQKRGGRASTTGRAGYVIREPRSVVEFAQVAGVFKAVFEMRDQAAPPAWLMEDTAKAGGVTLGLWLGEEPVGCSFAFPGIDHGRRFYLYSDGLAVLPDHRGRGRAYEMKLAQREHAIRRGYRRVIWTFSALRSVNAFLYLTRLGATGYEYLPDKRGALDSEWGTEGGVPFDEFLIAWDLDSKRVRARLRQRQTRPTMESVPVLTRCSGDAPRRVLEEVMDPPGPVPRVAVEIAPEYQELVDHAPDLARDWHEKTRPLFRRLLGDGFLLTECVHDRDTRRTHYLFERAVQSVSTIDNV